MHARAVRVLVAPAARRARDAGFGRRTAGSRLVPVRSAASRRLVDYVGLSRGHRRRLVDSAWARSRIALFVMREVPAAALLKAY